MQGSARRMRRELADRLRARQVEIEQAILTRVSAISDPSSVGDPSYGDGLRAALSAAIEFGLAGVESAGSSLAAAPVPLLAQARLAARNGIALEVVMRRYFAGYTLLGDFLVEEVKTGDRLDAGALKRVLRDQAALFDRLLCAVGEEHRKETGARMPTRARRHAASVQRLLDGELVDAAELGYDLDAVHVGAIAVGPRAEDAMRMVDAALDARTLLVHSDGGLVWAWFGGRKVLDVGQMQRLACPALGGDTAAAFGEPADGLPGWRLTHRQALAALPVARRRPDRVARYGTAALLTAVLQDDLHLRSLRQLFIAPIENERDGGRMAFETLRAYFAAERNAASAAAKLGISRQAVTKRLRMVEERLDRSVGSCAAGLEIALEAWELEEHAPERLTTVPSVLPPR